MHNDLLNKEFYGGQVTNKNLYGPSIPSIIPLRGGLCEEVQQILAYGKLSIPNS